MANFALGWKRDSFDARDRKLMVAPPRIVPLVEDLRAHMPPVWNQGQEGSCTGHGCGAVGAYEHMVNNTPIDPSRQFIYYNGRLLEHTTGSDSGCQIRDVVKAMSKYGMCHESSMPYSDTGWPKRPSASNYTEALGFKITEYSRVNQTSIDLKNTLASKFPIVFGIDVYTSFMGSKVAKTGIVPMPQKGDALEGGHCVVIVGYDDSKQMYICRNSWGTSWGLKGYFYLPYAYVLSTKLSSDFWVVQK